MTKTKPVADSSRPARVGGWKRWLKGSHYREQLKIEALRQRDADIQAKRDAILAKSHKPQAVALKKAAASPVSPAKMTVTPSSRSTTYVTPDRSQKYVNSYLDLRPARRSIDFLQVQ